MQYVLHGSYQIRIDLNQVAVKSFFEDERPV